jgi:hypothetical protein
VTALFFLVVTIRAVLTRGPESGSVPMPLSRRVVELVGGWTWNALFNAAGISLLLHMGGGLYLLAANMFLMFGWNIYVARVLITEVSE